MSSVLGFFSIKFLLIKFFFNNFGSWDEDKLLSPFKGEHPWITWQLVLAGGVSCP